MPIKIGSSNITDIKVGSTPVYRVDKGGVTVWNRGLDTQRVTIGSDTHVSVPPPFNEQITVYYTGFQKGELAIPNSACDDGTCNWAGGVDYDWIKYITSSQSTSGSVSFQVDGNQPNSGFTTMYINGVAFQKADVIYRNYASAENYYVSTFSWSVSSSPFGTAANGTKFWVYFV